MRKKIFSVFLAFFNRKYTELRYAKINWFLKFNFLTNFSSLSKWLDKEGFLHSKKMVYIIKIWDFLDKSFLYKYLN